MDLDAHKIDASLAAMTLELSHLLATPFLLLLLVSGTDGRGLAATATTGGSGDDGRHRWFAYNGFAGANLTLDGAAAVTASGILMLTNGTIQQKGHAFHPSTVAFRGARSFSTTFVFAIFGQYIDLSSPGMGFFVTTSRSVLATALPGQFMGLLNATANANPDAHIFAVELDTLLNAECRDMSTNHVGVDLDSLVSRGAADAGYYDDATGRFLNLSLISRKAMQVWADYDGDAAEVTVTMAPLGVPRPRTPLLRTSVDLSPVVRDAAAAAYVGFSSATGILFARHMVLGWSFALDGPAPALDIPALPALPPSGPRTRSSKVLEVVLPVASAAAVLAVGVAGYVLVRRRLRYAEVREDWEAAFGPHRFSYKDLFHATKGFSDDNLLGTGGFGSVYKGALRPARRRRGEVVEIAVKRVSHESRQGMKEFIAEVVSMRRLRHRNLVQLLGYCRRKGQLLLVYDYMPNGSLDRHLYGDRRHSHRLEWPRRFHVIRGVASALSYLHEDWEQVVVHRDVKASNVLLDDHMNGRLGDFGLARLYDHGSDARTTHVVGTMGYLAPELGHTGRSTPATDVFAFGAFLLEVACGRRPIAEEKEDDGDGDSRRRVVLVDWVAERWRRGSITDALDVRVAGRLSDADLDQVALVLKLGLLCSHPLPSARPTMRQVMQYLDGDALLPADLLPPAYLSSTTMLMAERMYSTQFLNENNVTTTSSTSVGAISDLSGGGR